MYILGVIKHMVYLDMMRSTFRNYFQQLNNAILIDLSADSNSRNINRLKCLSFNWMGEGTMHGVLLNWIV